jgi:hypothetical protein
MGDWFRAFRGLLVDAKPAWWCIGGLVIAATFAAIPPGAPAANRVLYGGVWLQLFGLGFVARGFSDRQRIFELPSVRSRVTRWFVLLRRIITARPQNIVLGAGGVTLGGATLGGAATVSTSAQLSSASIQRQLELLSQEISILRGEIDKRFVETDQRVAALQTRIDDDKNSRLRDHAALASKIHDLAVGDLDYEVVGFVWLVLSTFATAIPSDVIWLISVLS